MRGLLSVVVLLAIAAGAPGAAAQDAGIGGRWSPMDGSTIINIAPCAAQASRLCAVVEQETLAPGEPSLRGQVVVGDLAPSGRGRWRGRYVEGGVDYGATVRLISPSLVEFRICVAPFLCATDRYRRTGT